MDTLVVPARRQVGYALLGLAAVLAVATVLSDPAGRLLTAPGVVGALVLALRDVRGGELLRADADGLTVRSGWRTVAAPWPEVERMRVARDRRTELLELDLGRTVVLLTRNRMGRLPADVLTELLAVRDQVSR
ncbi:MAG: PH domain-containing protein [Actinobacteria bacterium]|nr:PH domain-containing protein [Actinomycetota bacterium]MCA1721996.1 PH domain-containing protein [Actinomycetota bacterium]